MTSTTTLRQADLNSLASVLSELHARAIDIVLPGSRVKFNGINLELTDIEPIVSDDGVTNPNGLYLPTSVGEEGLASKFGINLPYLRQCRTKGEPDLYANNINTWAQHDDYRDEKYLLRLFRADDSVTGVLRAVLSDTYRTIDNIDVLMAALDGMKEAGLYAENTVIEADLTERRMIVRVTVPQVAVLADKLLENYRSPFDGTDVGHGWTPERVARISEREGEKIDPRTVFAGFVISNSEVGGSKFRIFPQLVVQVCGNGLSLTASGTARRHVGSELEEGVQWSKDTQDANLELIIKKTRDSVKAFMDESFLAAQVQQLEEAAGAPITHPEEVIATVAKKLGFPEETRSMLLSHFIRGGQTTAGGVLQAVTSVAQVVRDGDTAYEMEIAAVKAMELARQTERELVKA